MQIILAPLVALVAVLVLTPHVRRLAFRVGALDSPDHRKVHQGVMPRLGGLAIYASFIIAVLVCVPLSKQLWGLLAGATLITALGILDDIYRLSARTKLVGQVLASIVVIFFGIKITFVSNPFVPGVIVSLGILAAPLTVVWLVVVINAVNLIDGLDGLASGTSFIAALTMTALIALDTYHVIGSIDLVMVSLPLIVAAATAGFLKFNFHPASIFLGDGGSMLLGFLLANMAIMGLTKSATVVSVVIPVVILGVPLMDTVFAVIRRFNRNMPIMQPDREHLHHRLLELGLNHRQAVLAIYGVNTVLGGIAILLTMLAQGPALILVEGVLLAAIVVANQLGIIGKRLRTNYLISLFVILYGLSIFIFFFPKF
ncbi:MraY family glycosyltransferase [Desulforamulus ruminis]|uniref:Glycosyl transferase, family 4, conserved region n=1 Tax=Desulforamulus ruminis (strain ATCC 23193 / DSM 2154 / NCIMB 8452 / DL) TaxID=696281 RepID=F6DVE3_DESRL|nr:Glycosyl transferase, family 4, conserved region [Desulforamulus ruminis DSM 2154]